MFLNNKYTKWYMKLMSTRKAMDREKCGDGSLDSHHIIPRSMGGGNDYSNIVNLTPREHFIAQVMLTKMTEGKNRKNMVHAARFFLGKNKKREGRKITSRTHAYIIRESRKAILGENHPLYGVGHTEESKRKMSESQKAYARNGNLNSFYGKTHSKESKAKMSKATAQPIEVLFLDGSKQTFSEYGELGTFLGKSVHMGAKLNKPQFTHLWEKYNIESIKKL